MRISFFVPLAALLITVSLSPAQASDSLNICTNASGNKILSSEDCPPGYQTDKRTLNPNVLDSKGLRDWAKRSKPLKVKSDRQRAEEARAALRVAERQERRQRCENARRDYSFESTWNSPKSRSRKGSKRVVMDRECRGL